MTICTEEKATKVQNHSNYPIDMTNLWHFKAINTESPLKRSDQPNPLIYKPFQENSAIVSYLLGLYKLNTFDIYMYVQHNAG